MSVPPRSRMVPAQGLGRPAGPPSRATVWRTGRGAGALAVLCTLATETEVAGKNRAARDVRSRAACRDLDGRSGLLRCAARQVGEITARIQIRQGDPDFPQVHEAGEAELSSGRLPMRPLVQPLAFFWYTV
jgi:hypothetical protein